MCWLYGFKLQAIINHKGELLAIKVTPGNTDYREPLKQGMADNLFGNRGYIKLKDFDIDFVAKLRNNMKEQKLKPFDESLPKGHSLIETVFDELKNLCQIEYSRHRSVVLHD